MRTLTLRSAKQSGLPPGFRSSQYVGLAGSGLALVSLRVAGSVRRARDRWEAGESLRKLATAGKTAWPWRLSHHPGNCSAQVHRRSQGGIDQTETPH